MMASTSATKSTKRPDPSRQEPARVSGLVMSGLRALVSRDDTRGAVIVEKLIAYFPTLLFFFATWQVAEMYTAKLIVDRAASAAGRAAAVVLADDPFFYDQ